MTYAWCLAMAIASEALFKAQSKIIDTITYWTAYDSDLTSLWMYAGRSIAGAFGLGFNQKMSDAQNYRGGILMRLPFEGLRTWLFELRMAFSTESQKLQIAKEISSSNNISESFLSMYTKSDHMINCPNPNCNMPIEDDSDFCYFCKTHIIPETSTGFIYNLLFELMQLEETRRQDLDSKAATYIGLLGVSLTVLTASGGIIVLQGEAVHEINNFNLATSSYVTQYVIYISYILIVILFILAVLFAFLAYSTGSNINEEEKCYQGIGYDYAADLANKPLYITRDKLIRHLTRVTSINYYLNNAKSKKIKKAFWLTIFAIFLLLVQSILIGLIGMKVL